jgi:hypothetical protein
MKTGRTLQQLAAEIARRNAAKRDFIVSAEALGISDDASAVTLTLADGADFHSEDFGMTDLFHRQIGSVFGIPAKYYDKMRAEYPSLLADNVNAWLGRADSRHTIRTLDGTARAFLSDRYRRIDNYEIAQTVLPLIGEMPDARVESCDVTDHRMYLKVVNPRLEMDVIPGDTVQAGIVISNSEVGLGSVNVQPLVYRLVCSNGMVINDFGKRKYHVGRENEESWELFSDETLQADDAAFMLKLADVVRSTIDTAKFSVIVDKLRESAAAKITSRLPDVVELTAKNYGFNQTEQDDILQHLIQGGDLSLYGLGNAVTRTASDVDSYDRATALETAGWQIVTMPPQLWTAINDRAAAQKGR